MAEQKAHRGRIWTMMGNEQLLCGMWDYFTLEREGARKILADAAWEQQEGIQGQCQQESPFREVLEQVKRSADADSGPQMMRRGYFAMKNVSWGDIKEEYRKEGKSCEWTFKENEKGRKEQDDCVVRLLGGRAASMQ